MNQPKRLMVMAGGTGGHGVPGAGRLRTINGAGWQVRWLGTADAWKPIWYRSTVLRSTFIRISGLRGKGLKALLLSPVRIFNAWRQARTIMKRFKPDVVLGMGATSLAQAGWLRGH